MIRRRWGYRDVLKIFTCTLIVQISSYKSWRKLNGFREEGIMNRPSFSKGDSGTGA